MPVTAALCVSNLVAAPPRMKIRSKQYCGLGTSKISENNFRKFPKVSEGSKVFQRCRKVSNSVQNVQKCPKCSKVPKNVQKFQKVFEVFHKQEINLQGARFGRLNRQRRRKRYPRSGGRLHLLLGLHELWMSTPLCQLVYQTRWPEKDHMIFDAYFRKSAEKFRPLFSDNFINFFISRAVIDSSDLIFATWSTSKT